MDGDDGLAGSRPSRKPERPAEVSVDVLALLGVQKDSPCRKVATLDDPPELVVVLDVGKLHLRGRALEGFDDLLVLVQIGFDRFVVEAVLLPNVLD